jgi:hypothetical protein
MKISPYILLLFLINFLACNTSDLELVQNGSTDYELILPQKADSNELKSAHELQKYMQEISGVLITIRNESLKSSNPRILIGNTESSKSLNVKPNEIILL